MQGVSAITLADLGSPVRRLPSPTKSPTPSFAKNTLSFFHCLDKQTLPRHL